MAGGKAHFAILLAYADRQLMLRIQKVQVPARKIYSGGSDTTDDAMKCYRLLYKNPLKPTAVNNLVTLC